MAPEQYEQAVERIVELMRSEWAPESPERAELKRLVEQTAAFEREHEQAWLAECDARVAAHADGTEPGRPMAEVFERCRARLTKIGPT